MVTDPRKRQKKLTRRAAKRKSTREVQVKEKNAGLVQRLVKASHHPILHCGVTEALWTQGLGWVWLSRLLANGWVAFAVFLVDRYCLGVKNALADISGRFHYEDNVLRKLRKETTPRQLAPAAARKLVEAAVAYALSLGLSPHADYDKARHIFGDIDAGACSDEFEFGKDGKPFFMAGPHESATRCRHILNTLTDRCGADGFHYLLPFADSTEVLPEPLWAQPSRVISVDKHGGIRAYSLPESPPEEPQAGEPS